jgi:hypothetical protein
MRSEEQAREEMKRLVDYGKSKDSQKVDRKIEGFIIGIEYMLEGTFKTYDPKTERVVKIEVASDNGHTLPAGLPDDEVGVKREDLEFDEDILSQLMATLGRIKPLLPPSDWQVIDNYLKELDEMTDRLAKVLEETT